VDRVGKTVPGGWSSNGKSPAAVRVESVTRYVQWILLSRKGAKQNKMVSLLCIIDLVNSSNYCSKYIG